MKKSLVVCLLVLTNGVSAQTAKQSVENEPYKVAAPKRANVCFFEDKMYTEGAVKKVDGQTMICMQKERLIVYSAEQNEEQELVWELSTSSRGKLRFAPSAK